MLRRAVVCGLSGLLATIGAFDADARGGSRAVAAQYQELQRAESCAWRRVVQGPLWSVPGVSYGTFLIAWDCDIHEAQVATAKRVAFERQHRVYTTSSGESFSPGRARAHGDTAWYPAGFR